VRCSSSPIVTSVPSIDGSCRISRAIRSPISLVVTSELPSGARTLTSNRASSLIGMNPVLACLAMGPIVNSEPTAASTRPSTMSAMLIVRARLLKVKFIAAARYRFT